MIQKGVISAVDGSTATVIPSFSDAPVSPPLTIPFFLLGALRAGVSVVYVQFDDNTGVILSRMDGGWNQAFPSNISVSGVITAADVSTSGVASLNNHKHMGSGEETSGPIG